VGESGRYTSSGEQRAAREVPQSSVRCAAAACSAENWRTPSLPRSSVPLGSTITPSSAVTIERELRQLARRQAGCRALMTHYGVGELTAPVILCELGDVSRLSSSRKAVRLTGLDVGVHRSDRRSRTGRLTKQGSPQLRWALTESAQAACRPTSPDRADYLALKQRGLTHPRASIKIARKLARRCFHTLRELGPQALEPVG
jgi:Transposase IS116/IS110/IS902 family